MKRKFAILLSAMLLTQAVCGCGGYVFRFGFNGQHHEQIERKSGDRDG